MAQHKLFSALVVYPYYHEPVPARFFKFDESDLEGGRGFDCEKRQVEAVLRGEDPEIPIFAGICRVGRRLFLVGGMVVTVKAPPEDSLRNSLWSFDAGSPELQPGDDRSTWSFCAEMGHWRGLWPLAVPYQGWVLTFGAEPRTYPEFWVEIYDPESGKMLDHRVLPEELFAGEDFCRPCAYFLRGREIVMDIMYKKERHHLVSYDAEANRWETIDAAFPALRGSQTRSLIHFGGSTLLIIDFPFVWSVYDMNSRSVTGDLTLPKLKEFKRDVKFAYHKPGPGPDTCLFVYVFLENWEDRDDMYRTDLPYAKVKVIEEGPGQLSATVEFRGVIEIGEYAEVYIFDGELEPGLEPGDEEKKASEKALKLKEQRQKAKKAREKAKKQRRKMEKKMELQP